jgi:hypothetical protein
MKLFEFTALVRCALVVAAEDEEIARKEIETYERTWFEIGSFIEVSDVGLIDVRDTNDPDDDAHVVCR